MKLKITGGHEGGSFEQIYRMPNFRQKELRMVPKTSFWIFCHRQSLISNVYFLKI